MEKMVHLEIKGMHCPDCPTKIERALSKLEGVSDVQINYENETGIVIMDPQKINTSQITNQISKMNFQATPTK